MKRVESIVGSAIFFFLAPGFVAVAVPWWISAGRMREPLLRFAGFRVLGGVFIVLGLPVLLDSFARFAWEGLGTPAPVAPTQHLVTTGLYRYVRNPMYIAVGLVIFGQGFLLGNGDVLGYGVAVCTAFAVFVRLYEEPTLRKTFGSEYDEFCAQVPRWIPRARPWRREQPKGRQRDAWPPAKNPGHFTRSGP